MNEICDYCGRADAPGDYGGCVACGGEFCEEHLHPDHHRCADLPPCDIIGTDGNVFAIIGKVSRTLKNAGVPDKAKEFSERAMKAQSYDEVLTLLQEYVDAR